MERQINKFDRQEIEVLFSEIQSALEIIKNKYGLAELNIGSVSFTMFSFTGKINGAVTEYQDFAKSYATEEAKYFAIQNGLPENILNRKFLNNGKNHTIIRIETRNPRYPVITSCAEDGKHYKFSCQVIKEILARTKEGNENEG